MKNVWRRSESLEESERNAAEKTEPLVVITEAVDRVAREILWRVNQESGRAIRIRVPDARAGYAPAPIHVQVVNDLFSEMPAINLLEERKHKRGVFAILYKSLGQRT